MLSEYRAVLYRCLLCVAIKNETIYWTILLLQSWRRTCGQSEDAARDLLTDISQSVKGSNQSQELVWSKTLPVVVLKWSISDWCENNERHGSVRKYQKTVPPSHHHPLGGSRLPRTERWVSRNVEMAAGLVVRQDSGLVVWWLGNNWGHMQRIARSRGKLKKVWELD